MITHELPERWILFSWFLFVGLGSADAAQLMLTISGTPAQYISNSPTHTIQLPASGSVNVSVTFQAVGFTPTSARPPDRRIGQWVRTFLEARFKTVAEISLGQFVNGSITVSNLTYNTANTIPGNYTFTASDGSTTYSATITILQPLAISGVYFTNQSGQTITMPAASNTTAVNIGWTTNQPANCSFAGVGPQNGDGTTTHFATINVTPGPVTSCNAIACTQTGNASNTATYSPVVIQIQNPPALSIKRCVFHKSKRTNDCDAGSIEHDSSQYRMDDKSCCQL